MESAHTSFMCKAASRFGPCCITTRTKLWLLHWKHTHQPGVVVEGCQHERRVALAVLEVPIERCLVVQHRDGTLRKGRQRVLAEARE